MASQNIDVPTALPALTGDGMEEVGGALPRLSTAEREWILSLVRQLLGDTRMTNSPDGRLRSPAEGIPLWVAKLRSERYSPRTIDLYRRLVENYLKRDPLPTSTSIRGQLADRLTHLSSAFVSCEQKALKSFFTFLAEENLWQPNPMEGIKAMKITYRTRECPADEDVWKLLSGECFHSHYTLKLRTMLLLLVDTGLRLTEAASILKRDIDFERLRIRVTGKGDKERWVPLSPLTAESLRKYLEQVDRSSPYLFPARNRLGYWDSRSLERSIERLCRRHGIKRVTPHQLRHYFATYSLKHGAKLEVVSRMLGHASVGITADIYRHVLWDEIEQEHRVNGPLAGLRHPAIGSPSGPSHNHEDGLTWRCR